MDPLLPLGVLSACLDAYSGSDVETVKRCSFDSTSVSESKLDPTVKPVKIKYLSNLFKDVHHGFTRMSESLNSRPSSPPEDDSSFVSKESDKETTSNPIVSSSKSTENVKKEQDKDKESQFQIKLPANFEPLRSKFCCESFRIRRSSSLATNSYLSPALADDEMMMNLPHVDIMVSHMLFVVRTGRIFSFV